MALGVKRRAYLLQSAVCADSTFSNLTLNLLVRLQLQTCLNGSTRSDRCHRAHTRFTAFQAPIPRSRPSRAACSICSAQNGCHTRSTANTSSYPRGKRILSVTHTWSPQRSMSSFKAMHPPPIHRPPLATCSGQQKVYLSAAGSVYHSEYRTNTIEGAMTKKRIVLRNAACNVESSGDGCVPALGGSYGAKSRS